MAHETVTVNVRTALRDGQARAARTGRTQQIELGEDLFIRIAPGGRKFLLFCLGDGHEPDQATARAAAEVLGLRDPQYGWHQGQTLRSLTVVEADETLLSYS
ncbi:hypothetical protein [Deinococcus radiophilus]|uniref:Uncharacterized protein n=1 Tax=Deinococcus radiophilus TaxID=32062 RepID=A0A3S0KFV0_9DEIO|nr:hypothetical protein [Deinococcus radiophilus]RTR29916.1 hypothetical protein EJ104_02945 [Deinococcus radiophilus]UFA49730.1 hypothetical protein LMT64_07465 [Deinococcus radiophilus]